MNDYNPSCNLSKETVHSTAYPKSFPYKKSKKGASQDLSRDLSNKDGEGEGFPWRTKRDEAVPPAVIDCTATDLVGKYLGNTGLKVINLLEQALGKVLLIDEAYRLAPEKGSFGSFQQEALGELVDSMTKLRYAGKLDIVLAGYEKDMNVLLRSNQGLASRFATEVIFRPMNPHESLELLRQRVGELGIDLVSLSSQDNEGIAMDIMVFKLFQEVAATTSWANGRDIETLAKTLIGDTIGK